MKQGESPSLIEQLKSKISLLLNQLIGSVSKQQLKGILGSLAVFFGLAVSNSANAQIFAAPVDNPFGIIANPLQVAIPELVDLDGDGDLDLISGSYYGALDYFENTGTAEVPAFAALVQNPFGLVSTYYFSFATACDLDNDGDYDLLVGEYYGNMQYFENTGTATAPAFAAPVLNPFGLTPTYQLAIPVLTDLDGDGDFDLLVGEYYGNMQYFENTGTPAFANFSTGPVLNPFGLLQTAGLALPESADLDGDGDFDILVAEYYGNVQYFENTGTNLAPAFAAPVMNPFGIATAQDIIIPTIGDLDNDGDLDIITGAYYGLTQYFENTSINVSLVELEDEANIFPNPFTDNVTIETNLIIERIEIYSVSGQLVLTFEQPTKTLNLSSLDEGIYMLHAISDDGLKTCNKLRKL